MSSIRRIPIYLFIILSLALIGPFGCGGGGGDDDGGSGTEEPSPFFNGESTLEDSSATPVMLTLADGTKVMAAPDELLLEFSEDATVADMIAVQSALTANGITLVGEDPDLMMLQLRIDPGRMNELIASLGAMSGVAWVGPNILMGLDDHQPFPVALFDSSDYWRILTRQREAGELSQGCENVPIGVVDSGVNMNTGWFDPAKMELLSRPRKNILFEGGLEDTHKGGHGTDVTGIIAGTAMKNPFYIVIPQPHPSGLWGAAYVSGISRILTEMGDRKGVINMSGGTGISPDRFGVLRDSDGNAYTAEEALLIRQHVRLILSGTLRHARQKDVVLVMSAGNDTQYDDQRLPTGVNPAMESDWRDYAITVGSLTTTGNGPDGIPNTTDDALARSGSTRWGPSVDLYVPASNIGVINVDSTRGAADEYKTGSGTSFGAPQVTAAVALIRCANPNLTAAQIKRLLLDTATPTTLNDGTVVPMLNVRNALLQAMATAPGGGVTVKGKVMDADDRSLVGGALLTVQLKDTRGNDASITAISSASATIAGGYNYQISIPYSLTNVGTLPDYVILNCTHDEYRPSAANINMGINPNITDFLLEKGDYLLIDGALHHLGDGNFTGTVNSQFQMPAEGSEYAKNFPVTAAQAAYLNGTLYISIRGAEENNTVEIWGSGGYTLYDYLNSSPSDGSMWTRSFPFDPSQLIVGGTLMRIVSTMDGFGDYDDFEFTNLIITFSN